MMAPSISPLARARVVYRQGLHPLRFLFDQRLGDALSVEMWRARRVRKEQKGFSHTIDAGRFGICLWDGLSSVPVEHDLEPYLG